MMMFQSHSPLNLLNATQEQGSPVKCKILGAKTAVSERAISKEEQAIILWTVFSLYTT